MLNNEPFSEICNDCNSFRIYLFQYTYMYIYKYNWFSCHTPSYKIDAEFIPIISNAIFSYPHAQIIFLYS